MTAQLSLEKASTKLNVRLSLSRVLTSRALQYQDVAPEYILDLLEESTEVYTMLAPTLSCHLRNLAREEIEFFLQLYQNCLKNSFPQQTPQLPEKLLRQLSQCRLNKSSN
jgi:hypothetical protein